MEICCLGDIHFYSFRRDLVKLVKNIKERCRNSNAIVIVGDISSSGNLGFVYITLSTIRDVVDIPVLVVPGNHDIFLNLDEMGKGIDSLLKLDMFNEAVRITGCIPLMKKPYVIGDTGFVGTIGWYDYSFAPDYLGLSIEDFKIKYYGIYIWADKEYVRLPISDEEFTQILLNKFEEHIKEVYDKVDKIVAVMHHLPFRELVHYKHIPEWDYFSTFMGSQAFGEIIRKYVKIKLVLHGHQHNGVGEGTCREVHGIKCCNCGTSNPIIIKIKD